ncbi:diaminopimelate decarboxylase [Hyphococcus flavus]|uniref:Diaminopimelate decarboxylase n=1 Tax=Hyphococcus flavus TaxID=1866326 RepID=A0AAF0CEG0_9PROT|nr:diaminopimelate decarboxylase [Hyphococcus flavus]WDI30104.1 diaminopimelate decarboxylase [Hyphococcus flavus]
MTASTSTENSRVKPNMIHGNASNIEPFSETALSLFHAAMGASDDAEINENHELTLGGTTVSELVEGFGAPLFVISETTLRSNFHRFRSAFHSCWDESVEVLYAVKANPNPVLCRILSEEGAGFDCTGYGELKLAIEYGRCPAKTTLNGSNKTQHELKLAIEAGAMIVVDVESDLSQLAYAASGMQSHVKVLIRLKAFDAELMANFESDAYPSGDGAAQVLARKKWGLGFEAAKRVIEKTKAVSQLELAGYHLHIGRLTRNADAIRANATALSTLIGDLNTATGFSPKIIDIGGGWPSDRDPEARTDKLNPFSIEDYADCVCAALREGLNRSGMKTPILWLEPGRYLVNNAGVLLTRVGCIKHDEDRCWVNVDASGEWLVLTTLHGARNLIVPTSRMERNLSLVADVVGPNCIPAVFGKDRPLPELERGEMLAVFDAGAYGESQASQFNSIPRPASVLVCRGNADLVTRRETIDDLFARYVTPERFE